MANLAIISANRIVQISVEGETRLTERGSLEERGKKRKDNRRGVSEFYRASSCPTAAILRSSRETHSYSQDRNPGDSPYYSALRPFWSKTSFFSWLVFQHSVIEINSFSPINRLTLNCGRRLNTNPSNSSVTHISTTRILIRINHTRVKTYF